MKKNYSKMDMDELLMLDGNTLTLEEVEQLEENKYVVWFERCEYIYQPDEFRTEYITLAYPNEDEVENYEIRIKVSLEVGDDEVVTLSSSITGEVLYKGKEEVELAIEGITELIKKYDGETLSSIEDLESLQENELVVNIDFLGDISDDRKWIDVRFVDDRDMDVYISNIF